MSTIVCSHGFGAPADARGMYTEIARAFPEHSFVMFDYNIIHENGDIEVTPLNEQAVKLQTMVNSQEEGVIILAHSQGCIAASLINLERVKKVILLAPPVISSAQRVIDKLVNKPGSEINLEGISKLPRSDGTTTIITKMYIDSVNMVNPISLYCTLANLKPVTIIRATRDSVLGETRFDEVNAKVMGISADHDFTNDARPQLIAKLAEEF